MTTFWHQSGCAAPEVDPATSVEDDDEDHIQRGED